jgi:GH15 family glucan-1,4-alpha-glucosidase
MVCLISEDNIIAMYNDIAGRPESQMTSALEMNEPEPGALLHGAIGNGRVLALVAPTTAIEWLCLPRFDSPSIFGSLLDTGRGGTFRIDCVGHVSSRMAYERSTNVLRTRMASEDGELDVYDFAPRIPAGSAHETPLEIHRLLVPVRGQPRIRVHFDPRPDYARIDPQILPDQSGLEVRFDAQRLYLRSSSATSRRRTRTWASSTRRSRSERCSTRATGASGRGAEMSTKEQGHESCCAGRCGARQTR